MSKLILTPCPVCRSEKEFYVANNTATDLHIQKYGELYGGLTRSEWRICGNCGFVHQNPRPSVEALNHFYESSKYHPPEIPEAWESAQTYMEFARWYYGEKVEYAVANSGLQTSAVFDIGFGHGGVLRLFADRGWRAFGVECDVTLVNFARNTLGLGAIQQGILSSHTELCDKVDPVFSNHTFEHIADLHDAMKGVQKILKPDGYIFTAIPTYNRNRSHQSLEWMNSSHYSMFTHNSLNQLFAHYGFEEVAHTYRGWRKEVDDLWHLARFSGSAQSPSSFYEDPGKVRTYINLINPLRSIVYYPVYSNYPRKVKTFEAIKAHIRFLPHYAKMLFTSPRQFTLKAVRRLKTKHV